MGPVTDWTSVISTDFAVPDDRPLPDLVDDLCAMLAAGDPGVRDDTAYPVLAMWTGRGVLDGHLEQLGDRMADRLRHDEIQARTFATMILGWVVLRDARTGGLPAACVPRWRDAFATWWAGEKDLRGYDDRLGWLHAAAHGADTVRAFARSPRLGAVELTGLLDLTVDRLCAAAGYLYAHGEDDRIAYALASVLTRAELTADDATAWLGRVGAAIEVGEPGPVPAWASNTLRTLGALYVFADRGVCWFEPETGSLGPPVRLPHAMPVKERLAEVLRLAWRGLG
ncbi:hypothetical protein Voc01_079740 [Virgisporangium ochraceum]|uniref:DUF2785 domain-containing protein n=1 Tax=Virgisporangium ochraceum TaxID=65505 RepID=A0A8J4A1V4_9ACTN|nr:hypothetical protein Voc01_079740 [Virgisporangium ochraceum]